MFSPVSCFFLIQSRPLSQDPLEPEAARRTVFTCSRIVPEFQHPRLLRTPPQTKRLSVTNGPQTDPFPDGVFVHLDSQGFSQMQL